MSKTFCNAHSRLEEAIAGRKYDPDKGPVPPLAVVISPQIWWQHRLLTKVGSDRLVLGLRVIISDDLTEDEILFVEPNLWLSHYARFDY